VILSPGLAGVCCIITTALIDAAYTDERAPDIPDRGGRQAHLDQDGMDRDRDIARRGGFVEWGLEWPAVRIPTELLENVLLVRHDDSPSGMGFGGPATRGAMQD